jgi:SAM-dependent methyltransferase
VNRLHLWYCRSSRWSRTVEQHLLPRALAGVDLGDAVLELGPGLGVTTRLLAARTKDLTAVEVDAALAARLTRAGLTAVHADATNLPQTDTSFSAVVCFTMLHHLPSAQAQDRLFAEAFRVMRPGAVFAGSDSITSLRFRLYHLADTLTPVDPKALPARLSAAGFCDVHVATTPRAFRFRATRPETP